MPPKKKRKWNGAALITAAIRRIWAWSPLRREALKRAKVGKDICCEECGDITDKPEVHHDSEVVLHSMSKEIAAKLFPDVDQLTVVCKSCHLEKHRRDK